MESNVVTDTVIAVNPDDEVVGYYNKMEAHLKGILHRAISVFIVNSKGEWLLQQRAGHKYHSGSLWSNTACTHPLVGETNLEAAERRLKEEMGMLADLKRVFSFQYRADLDNELIENELDHIFVGYSDTAPEINKEEVQDYRYVSVNELSKEMNLTPERFTEWFKLLFPQVVKKLEV